MSEAPPEFDPIEPLGFTEVDISFVKHEDGRLVLVKAVGYGSIRSAVAQVKCQHFQCGYCHAICELVLGSNGSMFRNGETGQVCCRDCLPKLEINLLSRMRAGDECVFTRRKRAFHSPLGGVYFKELPWVLPGAGNSPEQREFIGPDGFIWKALGIVETIPKGKKTPRKWTASRHSLLSTN